MTENEPRSARIEELGELRDEIKRIILSDTPQGFELFFSTLFNRPFPMHARPWVQQMYDDHNEQKGTVIKAFRFSWKTTIISNAFLLYRIGLNPSRTNIIIQVKDETAEQTATKVAETIADNPVWKWIFPHVVPDGPRGWAKKGYYVKRTDMDYGEWLRSSGRDPTFVGYGYTSDSIIGKHPNGMLIIDDIHNEQNTASGKELGTVMKIVVGTIFPTISPKQTWVIFVGTPWVANDVLAYAEAIKGQFTTITTAIQDAEGNPTWPEEYGPKEIAAFLEKSQELEFRRMFMVDITATLGLDLKAEWLHEYPSEKINGTWQVVMGVDYASLTDPKNPRHHDYFALAVGVLIPGGGVVLIDGVYERLTQAEAEERVKQFAKIYPTVYVIGIETLGKGAEFYGHLLRASRLPVVGLKKDNQSKRVVYGKQLAPAFQSGRIRLTDSPTAFTIAFKNEWLSYPTGAHDDALDAVYYMLKACGEGLMDVSPLSDSEMESRLKGKPKANNNPWVRLAGGSVEPKKAEPDERIPKFLRD